MQYIGWSFAFSLLKLFFVTISMNLTSCLITFWKLNYGIVVEMILFFLYFQIYVKLLRGKGERNLTDLLLQWGVIFKMDICVTGWERNWTLNYLIKPNWLFNLGESSPFRFNYGKVYWDLHFRSWRDAHTLFVFKFMRNIVTKYWTIV